MRASNSAGSVSLAGSQSALFFFLCRGGKKPVWRRSKGENPRPGGSAQVVALRFKPTTPTTMTGVLKPKVSALIQCAIG